MKQEIVEELEEEEKELVLSYDKIPLSKNGQERLGAQFASLLADAGEDEALTAYIKLKSMAATIEWAISYLEPHAREEASGFSAADVKKVRGVGFNVSSGSAKYDYSGDDRWNELKAKEAKLKEELKEWQTVLRNTKKRMVDPETGVYITPAVQETMGNEQLRITFPK